MAGSPDPFLLTIMIVITIVMGSSALDLGSRLMRVAAGSHRRWWFGFGAIVLAAAIWSVQWLCLHLLHDSLRLSYDWRLTALGWIVDTGLCFAALGWAQRSRTSTAALFVAAGAAGLAMASTHYLTVAAMRLSPAPALDVERLAASLLLAVIAAAAAIRIMQKAPKDSWLLRRLLPAAILGLGFVGMHWLASQALPFAPGARSAPGNLILDRWLGLPAVFGLSTLVASSLTLGFVDNRLSAEHERRERERDHAERVRRLTYYDRATGLPNRTLFNSTLMKRLALVDGRMPPPFGLLHVHLDQAQLALQACGAEQYADWLRQCVVPRFRERVGGAAIPFRFGLGSFMLLLPGATQTELNAAALSLLEGLPAELELDGRQWPRSPAWTVLSARYPTDGNSSQALILAVTQSKNAGTAVGRSGVSSSAMLTLA